MPDPSISPANVGATAYEITDARRVVADLRYNFFITQSLTFKIIYPSAAAGVSVVLVKDATSLDLLTGEINDATTFANRFVSANTHADGSETTLDCEIHTIADITNEVWSVRVSAPDAHEYRLTQINNNPAAPTIPRIMCDPYALFTTGGTGTVHAKETVELSAQPATWSPASPTVVGTPAPSVSYKWTCSPDLPGFPACVNDSGFTFIAPDVDAAQTFQLGLEVWFDGRCPDDVGFLHASAARQSLSVAPAEAIGVGPETPIPAPPNLSPDKFFTDDNNGLVAVWESNQKLFRTRLDLGDINTGFAPTVEETIYVTHAEERHATQFALLPDGDYLVFYARTKVTLTPHDPEPLIDTEICFKRGPFKQLAAAPEKSITNFAGDYLGTLPDIIVGNNSAALFYPGQFTWRFVEYPLATADFKNEPHDLSTLKGSSLHAAFDSAGNLWVAINNANIVHDTIEFNTGLTASALLASSNEEAHLEILSEKVCEVPFVLKQTVKKAGGATEDEIWVFWVEGGNALFCARFRDGAWSGAEAVPQSNPTGTQLFALADEQGGVWVFWTEQGLIPFPIRFTRRDPAGGAWTKPQTLATDGQLNRLVLVRQSSAKDFQAFYYRNAQTADGPRTNMFYKTLTLRL